MRKERFMRRQGEGVEELVGRGVVSEGGERSQEKERRMSRHLPTAIIVAGAVAGIFIIKQQDIHIPIIDSILKTGVKETEEDRFIRVEYERFKRGDYQEITLKDLHRYFDQYKGRAVKIKAIPSTPFILKLRQNEYFGGRINPVEQITFSVINREGSDNLPTEIICNSYEPNPNYEDYVYQIDRLAESQSEVIIEGLVLFNLDGTVNPEVNIFAQYISYKENNKTKRLPVCDDCKADYLRLRFGRNYKKLR